MAQTAIERLNKAKSPKVVILEKDFAGIRAGSSMFVATPKIVDEFINKMPYGRFITMPELRADLAIEYDCDATCPVSTAIFLRVVAEAALEHLEQGAKTADITPFWRVVAPGDKVSARLPIDQKWLEARRQEELG
ncbi:MAG: hypothetical protein VXX02_11490 [Pseudomonadota bacterium]|nr:hypothetical protein [Pseudomonadota bacterium]MEC7412501.1 hypothetical protein [Pseudomonadota bacterium]MEC7560903.1 hypothetical protein [Pseudomonadota bacterium]MEC7613895.1 hypothetical protein [Pseudomonadota bacterium]MEC7970408.1 hypothetical protein [Pseudomonadota bacterium]